MAIRPSLLFALSLALAAPAAAQLGDGSVRILSYNHLPTAGASLDLRAGAHLIELRESAGLVRGRLRGPRNEWLSQDLVFFGNCLGATTLALSTETVAASRSSNALRLVLTAGACRMHAQLPLLGLISGGATHGEPDCDPPEEIDQVAGTSDGPACAPPYEPEFPLAAPRPDLRPRPQLSIAGRSYRFSDRIVLGASQASANSQGRCVFDYSYSVENRGRAPAGTSDASLLIDSRLGLQLDSRPLGALVPGAAQTVQGRMALPPGIWAVYAHADAGDRIAEWDGDNNVRVARIEVTADCGR